MEAHWEGVCLLYTTLWVHFLTEGVDQIDDRLCASQRTQDRSRGQLYIKNTIYQTHRDVQAIRKCSPDNHD